MAALRQSIEVDSHKAWVSLELLDQHRVWDPHSTWCMFKDAAGKEGPEELALGHNDD